MAIKMSQFIHPTNFSILVNFPTKLKNVKNTKTSGYVLSNPLKSSLSVIDYLIEKTGCTEQKVLKALPLVKLKLSLSYICVSKLTESEMKRVMLAEVLLLQSKVIICEYFFKDLIFSEKEYFKRLFRNLMNKQDISVILIENDMNFVSETVKQFYLFTSKENFKLITDFYQEEIYQYVDKPFTVELVKYFESMGHQVDHDITFNETLKSIYRGVS